MWYYILTGLKTNDDEDRSYKEVSDPRNLR